MSRKDKMLQEADCVEAIFLDYIGARAPQVIFLFFEGKDDFKYYFSKIQQVSNKEYKYYYCNNKENVLKIHNMITKRSGKNNEIIKMFFVDKDFDDNSNIDNDIYVTPTYSIENLYFTDKAIESMIRGEMGLTEQSEVDKKDFNIACDYVKQFRDNIIKEILYGNACYSLQIRKSNKMGVKKPNLTGIKKYADIKNISKLEDIKEKIKNNYIEISEDEISEEYKRLSNNPVCLVRGKYLLEKMPKCIDKIVEESNKGAEHAGCLFSKKRRMSLNISEATLISNFSNYAEIPECLISYIENKCSLIQK